MIFSVAYRYGKSISIIERVNIYIVYIYIEFLHNIFTIPEEIYRWWAIMEELSYVDESAHFWSVGDRNVDLSSSYEFWFARKCIDINVIWLILNLSTAIQLAETVSVAGKQWRPGQKRRAHGAAGHKRQHVINRRLWALTAHAGLAIRQPPCSITRDIVVNRQQKLSNSSSHTQ